MWQSTTATTYDQRLGTKTNEASYHDVNICGSSFNGLATTLEWYAQNRYLDYGLNQIRRCIAARQEEANRRIYPDAAHNKAIEVLIDLYHKYSKLQRYHKLENTLVRYREGGLFTITIDGKEIIEGGRKNKSRKKTLKKRYIKQTLKKRQIKQTLKKR